MKNFLYLALIMSSTFAYADKARPVKCLVTGSSAGATTELNCSIKLPSANKTLTYVCMFTGNSWKRGTWYPRTATSPEKFVASKVCDKGVEYALLGESDTGIKGPFTRDNLVNKSSLYAVSGNYTYFLSVLGISGTEWGEKNSELNLMFQDTEYPSRVPSICYQYWSQTTGVSSNPIPCGNLGSANFCDLVEFKSSQIATNATTGYASGGGGQPTGTTAGYFKGKWWVVYPNPASPAAFYICGGGVVLDDVRDERTTYKRIDTPSTAGIKTVPGESDLEQVMYCGVTGNAYWKGHRGNLCKTTGCEHPLADKAVGLGCCRRVTSSSKTTVKWVRQLTNFVASTSHVYRATNMLLGDDDSEINENGDIREAAYNDLSSTQKTTHFQDCVFLNVAKKPAP